MLPVKKRRLKNEIAKNAPEYLPPGQRPKCQKCGKELIINIHHPWKESEDGLRSGLDLEQVERVDYGYRGNGIFCTSTCGFRYGLAVAIRLLHRKKEEQGSSGNPLVDNGTI